MKAVVIRHHGGLEQVEFADDYRDPSYEPDEVLVRVRAASLNYHDIFTRRGMPGIKLALPVIPGLDMAGEVEALGASVEGWSVGDRVLVDPVDRIAGTLMGETRDGGFAELCKVKSHQLIPLPDDVSFDQAAALPVAFGSAHRMIVTHGQLKAGEKVLVLGASGGVGVASVLLAKLIGADVVACTSSDEKGERLKALGAGHVINYAESDFVKASWDIVGKPRRHSTDTGFDMVVNFTGGDTWSKSLRCLKPQGRLVTNGATAGYDPPTDIRFIFGLELQIRGSTGFKPEDFDALLGMVREGKLDPPIDRNFSLEDGREAYRMMEDREVLGKIVLNP